MSNPQRESFNFIKGQVKSLDAEFHAIEQQLHDLRKKRSLILLDIKTLYQSLVYLNKQDKSLQMEDIVIPTELLIDVKPTTNIGDAVEALLNVYGTLTREEILDRLLFLKVKISRTNARIVLYNALVKDPKQRFKKVAAGMFRLRKENEKADAKG